MLTRTWPGGYLVPRTENPTQAARDLEDQGATVVRQAFSATDVNELRDEIESIYASSGVDERGRKRERSISEHFRYEMFNRSPLAQKIVGRREILDVIEPLLGEDCHIIANTCWRNPPSDGSKHGGSGWHIDAGPHVPLAPDQKWPENIPHPTFAVGVHIFLRDCPIECGPTGVIPGSHKSGRPPPRERNMDSDLTYDGVGVKVLEAKAGDVAFFVSDVWHRRMPPSDKHNGRFFLQVHYARRDIAQRIKPTHTINHIDQDAMNRIESDRERLLLGLHAQGFYDG